MIVDGRMKGETFQEIAGQLDQLPAGQSALGIVVGAVLIILLVLLITDILGLSNVFPFIKPATNL